jgi:hypothetical protein
MGLADRLGDFSSTGQGRRLGKLGMTPRQQHLNRLWAYYTCDQYAARTVDWDGVQHTDHIEHDSIATAGFVPPGFYMAGGQNLPVKFRRPTVQYHLAKVIVDRFTGLLFSERRHPKINIAVDQQSEDYMQALADEARLWPAMVQARTFGGATGSACMGFQFINGKPVIEVHDPRWVYPVFRDRHKLILGSIEKRYQYPVEVLDPEKEEWTTGWVWYRRVINEKVDVVFKPAPVLENGEEPAWEVQSGGEHNLGFCPAIWIQNQPVSGDTDGEPDCHGIYEMVEAMDHLQSQAKRAVMANCDPTLVIVSEAPMDSIEKGHNKAIKLPQGSASYLEISASVIKAAREQVEEIRKLALEVAQVVLEHPDTAQRTATEVERAYSSMLSKADVMREQYGERGVKPLMQMMLKAAQMMGESRIVPGKGVVRYKIDLPPKVEKPIEPGGKPVITERKLGKGPFRVKLKWPGYFEPSLQDANQAVQAASGALTTMLVDQEHAVKMVAEHFKVDDLGQLLESLDKAKKEQEEQMMGGMMGGMPGMDMGMDMGADMDMGGADAGVEASTPESPPAEPAQFVPPEEETFDEPVDEFSEEEPVEPEEPQAASETALNGAQVAAALQIVEKVVSGAVTAKMGHAMLMEFFNLSAEAAGRILEGHEDAVPEAQLEAEAEGAGEPVPSFGGAPVEPAAKPIVPKVPPEEPGEF